MEEIKKIENSDLKEKKKPSDFILIISIAIVILIIAVILGFRLLKNEQPKTIDDLHSLNMQGKLKPGQGYMHNGYSFVLANGLWYTQVQRGNNLFEIALHYGPEHIKDVPLTGKINSTIFNSFNFIYYTFNPLEQDQSYVTLSAGEFVRSIIAAFNKIPKAACDKNETEACHTVPTLTCNNTNLPLVYFKQETPTEVIFDNNCIIVSGVGPEIVRATDRMLLNLYGIMP